MEKMSRYRTINTLANMNDRVYEENVHMVEPDFFDIFDFTILEGDNSALDQMHQAIVTPEIAQKYFGASSAIGQTITLQVGGEWTDFSIEAIAAVPPGNSSLNYDIIIPFENTTTFMSEFGRQCWTCVSVETYILLPENHDIEDFASVVAPFIDKKVANDYQPGEYVVGFQPLADIHLNDKIPTGIASVSDPSYPYILSGIAFVDSLIGLHKLYHPGHWKIC